MENLSIKFCLLRQTDLFQIHIKYLKMINFDLITNENKHGTEIDQKLMMIHTKL